MTSPSVPRRLPTQQRSRERVERILDLAVAIIGEQGSDALKMSELAARAGVSIGSLYQYFPDKAAIVHVLAERYNAIGRACVAAELAALPDEAALAAAMARIVDGFHAMYVEHPVMRDIWSATQADRALQAIDAADMAEHGRLLDEALARVRPSMDPAARATLARLAMELLAAAVRLAIAQPPDEGARTLAAFKGMIPGVLGAPPTGR